MSFLSEIFKPKVKSQDMATEHSILYAREEQEQIRTDKHLPELDAEGNDPAAQIIYARVVQESQGYAYEIVKGGVVSIHQGYAPDQEGNVPMTKEEAGTYASELLKTYRGAE